MESSHPERVSILQMSFGVTLLSMDEMRELCRVADEEDCSPDVSYRFEGSGRETYWECC